MVQRHHLHPGEIVSPVPNLVLAHPDTGMEVIDLCESIEKHGTSFRPLVRNSFALHCGLKIVFLRKENAGRVFQGGDIDGRLKTLLDALAMPQHKEQVLADRDTPNPVHCLLEDDSLISGVNVETERLLTKAALPNDYAKLMIEVDVRIRQATLYNQSFLG